MTVRLHELAKELKLTSKEAIDKLKVLGVDVKSHMSVIEEKEAKLLKDSLVKKSAPAAPAPVQAPASSQKEKDKQTPSIENVKRELLLQRLNTVKPAAETKKPVTPSVPVRKPITPSPTSISFKPKTQTPMQVFKKPVPADIEKAAPAVVPAAAAPAEAPKSKKIEIQTPISVKDLAVKFNVKPSDLIGRLIKIGVFASMNQNISFEVAAKVAVDFGFELAEKQIEAKPVQENKIENKDKAGLAPRAAVVTFMGHVDHGKTSLLDAIRQTKVAAGEAGGITQHIGAYEVFLPKGAVTFLDTPGHEAFTQMRARGARATDVVVLVVAADDGVMPQTIEAIDHARAANVPIIVAINKMDLPSANPDRVKKALMEHGLTPEDWGGKTVMISVSAKTGKGIDELLDMLALESELLELRANPLAMASGVVVEAELSKGSGVLATVLVQDGTLRVGDYLIVGDQAGKVRAMINDRGQRVKEALPSMPVEILGLETVPRAGDRFRVVKEEREARQFVEDRQVQIKQGKLVQAQHITLEHLLEDVKAGKVEELKLVLKSDVQGSVEALRNTLSGIKSKNVRLNMIHTGIGDISESDVLLAAASNAVVIGFHVAMTAGAKEAADREQVDVRFYEIIYEVKTAIEKAMEGLLAPEEKEVFVGVAEVRQVFKVSKVGMIAGCSVQKGKIVRNFSCRVIRGGKRIHEGKVISLKRFKDDAREVLEGFECGIGVSNYDELISGDRIEVFEIQKKARKLE